MTALPQHPRASLRRRSSPLLLGAFIVACTTAVLAVANIAADRYGASFRADVTGSGDQTLSPRTRQLLARLDEPYRGVVAVDFRTVDPRSRQRLNDVLTEMAGASSKFTFSMIDTGSGSGVRAYAALVEELVERERSTLSTQASAIELASAGCVSLATYLTDTLSPSLQSVRQAIPPSSQTDQNRREFLDRAAAGARLGARDLSDGSGRALDALKAKLGEIAVPATDQASAQLAAALAPTVDLLRSLATGLRTLADDRSGPASDEARVILPHVEKRRDDAALVLESLRALRRPDLLRVTDVLSRGSAALIIGPPGRGLSALDVDSLLPSGSLLDASGAGRADLRRRAEELVSTALGSLLTPNAPVVVLVHAEPAELLSGPGYFKSLSDRFRLRGMDFVEWPVLSEDAPRALRSIDPRGERPTVYLNLSPDSSAAADATGLTGAQRAAKLAAVLERLAGEGKNLALSVNQSAAPTYGQPDPFSPILGRFGLSADSGRPLLIEDLNPRARRIDTDVIASPAEGTHPLAGCVRGLPAMLPWAVPLSQRPISERARLTTTPLYVHPAGANVWAESQWLRLWQTPRDQRSLLTDLPSYDEGRDARWPDGRQTQENQDWLLAAAVERTELGATSRDLLVQRAVVVGSNSWFIDAVTQQRIIGPDGRPGLRCPGNLELLDGAIAWLTNQDDLIAQSPSASAVALVRPIEHRALVSLRAAVMLGMPLLVLLMGGIYRVVRG